MIDRDLKVRNALAFSWHTYNLRKSQPCQQISRFKIICRSNYVWTYWYLKQPWPTRDTLPRDPLFVATSSLAKSSMRALSPAPPQRVGVWLHKLHLEGVRISTKTTLAEQKVSLPTSLHFFTATFRRGRVRWVRLQRFQRPCLSEETAKKDVWILLRLKCCLAMAGRCWSKHVEDHGWNCATWPNIVNAGKGQW